MFKFTKISDTFLIISYFILTFFFSDVKSIQLFLLNYLQTGGSCSLCIFEFDLNLGFLRKIVNLIK